MKHEQRVKFLSVWRKLFEHYQMSDVEIYGEPWRILKAMNLREKVSYIWKGGPCNEHGSFDVTVKVPSEKKFKFTSYEIHFKIRPNFEENFLQIEKSSSCYCADKRYLNNVSNFKLPCKHEIAGRMALERDLKRILIEQIEKNKIDKKILEFWIEKFYVEQEDMEFWYVRWSYPREIFEFKKSLEKEFNKLKNDRFFTSLLKYDIFYYNLAKALGKEDVEFYSEKDLFY